MLLIALSLQDDFYLPAERAERWYGISEDTAARGLRELEAKGLLEWRQKWIKNQRSDTGWIEQRHYTLLDPFSSESRKRAPAGEPVDEGERAKGSRGKARKEPAA